MNSDDVRQLWVHPCICSKMILESKVPKRSSRMLVKIKSEWGFWFSEKKSYNDQSRSSPCKFLAICQALEARRIFKARAVMQRLKYSASSVSQAWSSWQHPLSKLWSKSFSQHQEKVTFAAAPARATKQGGCQESCLNFHKTNWNCYYCEWNIYWSKRSIGDVQWGRQVSITNNSI